MLSFPQNTVLTSKVQSEYQEIW